jgi:hypothetical protein
MTDDSLDEHEASYDMGDDKAEAVIMREVADWLQSRHADEFWTPRCKQLGKVSRSHMARCTFL